MQVTTYKRTLLYLYRNYMIGSLIAVVGVGSTFMTMTLDVMKSDLYLLLFVQFFSLIIMFIFEYRAFQKDISPIRNLFFPLISANSNFTSPSCKRSGFLF